MSISQAKVAIITITYNSADFINEYLESLIPFLTASDHQLIIVDNASADNTCSLIEAFSKANHLSNNIQIVALEDNVGFGKGCNKGAEIAKHMQASHLWLLNPDTQVFPESGPELLKLLSTDNVDFAGSVLVNKERQPRAGAFRFPSILTISMSTLKLGILDKIFSKHTTAIPLQDQPYRADWLTGASFMTSAETFEKLKGFDPFYFLYYEEVDLFYRAQQAGYSVWATPKSQVFHISGASTGMNNHKKAIKRRPKYWFESRQYFYTANYGKAYFFLADIMFIGCHTLWTIRAKIQGKPIDTPPRLIKDILAHSLVGKLFPWKS